MSVEQIEACVLRAAHKLGYAEVRKHQAEAAMKFMQGDDVFVSLPTGSGKSLIYSAGLLKSGRGPACDRPA